MREIVTFGNYYDGMESIVSILMEIIYILLGSIHEHIKAGNVENSS